ncbi:chemotaxis protein CheW [Dechloromonas sp. ZY10]|uniref:chemotaxis protein CheW n=1 Tax=Dechloromonas aquae TaxID=2664436 RepID=UPI003527EDE3
MAIDMTQFYQVFFDESAEHLANMEALLLELDISDPDPEQLNAIFRAAHSIKGSAGTFGFSDLADTTHILENLLDRIRKQELSLREEMVDAFLETGDLLKAMLEAHQGHGEVGPASVVDICERLKALSAEQKNLDGINSGSENILPEKVSGTEDADEELKLRCYDVQFVPNSASLLNGGVASLISELTAIGNIEIVSQPHEAGEAAGVWHLKLRTSCSAKDFSEQIDFVADSGAWRVTDESIKSADDDCFGLFDDLDDSNGLSLEQESYGLFSDDGGTTDLDLTVVEEGDGAYGFFVESMQVGGSKPCEVDQGIGYGFFDAEDAFEPVEANALTGKNGDDEARGFGFFVPIPEPAETESNQRVGSQVVERIKVSLETVDSSVDQKPTATTAERKSARSALAAVAASGDSSIRVSVEKVDQLINLVGELVITQAMLLQTASQVPQGTLEGLVNGLAQLERNTRDLQESVMSIRMMPISFVFSRFPRVVRDLSGKLGKQVELKTSGETTELDKGLIERIADPLTHLIRNSLDHGIESPERRVVAGKSPVGTITLKAYHQGGNIVIEVGDDGAGLHRAKILSKARERGMQVSDQMTDFEVFNLIFEAGFSTADEITDVSGRGVGMDVVRRNIQSMGGRVEIDSMQGVGTRITVRLPLTLAILDGMSVAVGDQTYILPLSYVIESLQPAVGEIKTLSNQARVIQVRGEYLPVVVLHEMFGLKSKWKNLTQGIMVVLEADGMKAALFVDALVGQHQVVIKSLEANYRRVPGISGATIMGDGHVALILDVSSIAEMAKASVHKAA